MNAIIKSGGTAWFNYFCQDCGADLKEYGEFITHPEHDHWLSEPSACQYAGKRFKRPVQTIRLEEVKE